MTARRVPLSCPDCGGLMAEYRDPLTRSTFHACLDWDCAHGNPTPAAVEVARAGGMPPPGFGDEEPTDA